MATFLQRNKYYTIVFTDKTGRRRWESTRETERPLAEAYYREHIRFKDAHFRMTINDLSIELEKKLANRLSPKTVEMYSTKLSILVGIIGNKDIDRITSNDIEQYMSARHERGITKTTINIDLRTIRSAFNRAITMGVLSSNPCRTVEQYRNPHQDPAVLSVEQVQSVIGAEENCTFKVLWMMLYLTAARRGEILYLEWADIDFDRKTIRLRNKKDNTLKTKKPRTIPLSSALFETLLRMPRNGSFIFVKDNGVLYSNDYVSKRFKYLIRKLGLSEAYHLHTLRHSAATHMNDLGETSFNIQNSLGHSSISTTQLYIQTSPEALRGGYEKMAKNFNEAALEHTLPDQSIEPHDAGSAAASDYKSLSLAG
jgi:site-specific recombinase XerD